MKRGLKAHNKNSLREGEILISPEILDTHSQHQQTREPGRLFKYTRMPIQFTNQPSNYFTEKQKAL